jgi:hypothetical protein
MNLDPYLESIHTQLETTAQASGDEARELAVRLAGPLDSAIRLALQDALAAAAEEITVELAPGSVELRLRGREPQFVVTPAPSDPTADDEDDGTPSDWAASHAPAAGEEGAMSRINLRLPEHLKALIDQAADDEGLSVNAWLLRSATARLERGEKARRRQSHAPQGARRYEGWAR